MSLNHFICRVFLLLVFMALGFTSCKKDAKTIKQTEVFFKKEGQLTIFKNDTDSTLVALDIEIADTEYDIQTGLMYRNALQKNQAMLFVFEDARPRSFYMKNTRIPLDIIFIDADYRIVGFKKNAIPFDETSLPSNAPAKFVLEVNAGSADVWGLSVKDRVFIKNI